MVKEMFQQIGISGKTNHSLRATGASCLFEAKVPEKIVQERTGHRSLKALRIYERTTDEQHQEVSAILANCSRPAVKPVSQATEESKPLTALAPSFGVLHHCTININYGNTGPNTVNTQTQDQSK